MGKFCLYAALVFCAMSPFATNAAKAGLFEDAYADYRAKIGNGTIFYASCRTLHVMAPDDSDLDRVYLIVPQSRDAGIVMIEWSGETIVDWTEIERKGAEYRIAWTEGGIWSLMSASGLVDQLRNRDFRMATGEDLDHLPITGPQCIDALHHAP
ncbi:MAG TPA: hypothetical protein VMF53_10195 [Alphaproteobacteria bacterium]|nr:hypothetical protein [Alphaproteobacteria bacterium]